MSNLGKIRNFAIIAHIDHGKSTLADRLIEKCGDVNIRDMHHQVLDSMDIERERGITVKAQTVKLNYQSKSGQNYILNLIDTPGHVDFSYEVDRSLAACEGSILIIDVSQGVEAQTVSNACKAMKNKHKIILVLNKVDLPSADIKKTKEQVKNVINLDVDNTIEISAKQGKNITGVLESIVNILPPPKGKINALLKGMLIDSWYDQYLGVVILVRIIDGTIEKNMNIKMISTNEKYIVEKVGIFRPKKVFINKLTAGEIGFITCSIKKVSDCNIGDTIIDANSNNNNSLPGFKRSKPVIFCGIYPTDNTSYTILKNSIMKLQLNDSGLCYEPEISKALGIGFRCGFLGMLHLEIVQERLSREYNIDIITTAPNVTYQLQMYSGDIIKIHNPNDMPLNTKKINYIKEPWVKATIVVPNDYLGAILSLCKSKRGRQKSFNCIDNKVVLSYHLPLNEIAFDFYEKLKSCSKGYASCDWVINEYLRCDLVKIVILVNGLIVDGLSILIHKSNAEIRAREICKQLKTLIPRHLFTIPIQAVIGSRVIARETISPLRKDVTAKCYGGDISRKKKLLQKQKKGKKRMCSLGNINIPQDVFISIFKPAYNKQK